MMTTQVLVCRSCGGFHIKDAAPDDHVTIAVQGAVRVVTVNGRGYLSREGTCAPCLEVARLQRTPTLAVTP